MVDPQRTPSERDAWFAILADPRRRRLLEILEALEPERRTTLYDLSDRLATEDGPTDGEQRHDVAVTLHHIHLPKLDDAGLVEYDSEANVVETTELSSDRAAAGREIPVSEE